MARVIVSKLLPCEPKMRSLNSDTASKSSGFFSIIAAPSLPSASSNVLFALPAAILRLYFAVGACLFRENISEPTAVFSDRLTSEYFLAKMGVAACPGASLRLMAVLLSSPRRLSLRRITSRLLCPGLNDGEGSQGACTVVLVHLS